jgi:hypothetical protein
LEHLAENSKQREHSAGGTGAVSAVAPGATSLCPALQLQQQAGNQAVQQLLRSGVLQAKLAISNPDDPEEREADHIAQTVMPAPAAFPASTSCSCAEGGEMCAECQHEQALPTIRRHATASVAPAHVPRVVSEVLRSPGTPLDSATRAFFEPRFGHDFSHVRVHTGPEAAESARSINALAYTLGKDLVFSRGQYAPDTTAGRTLLAHELAHVSQQTRGGLPTIRRQQGGQGTTTGGTTPAPAAGMNPPSPPVPSTPSAAPSTPYTGPTIKQGPIGDVIIPAPNWTFFQPKGITKHWTGGLDNTTLLTVPIPDLGVRIGLSGEASASAFFTATLGPGVLRNIQIGLSYGQAAKLAALNLLVGEPLVLDALLIRYGALGEIRALADLEFAAGVSIGFSATGGLTATASALGLFNIATLGAELSATAHAEFPLKFGGPIGLYYSNGRLDFRFHQSLQAQLNLMFSLVASIHASLLGFRWSKYWNLVDKSLGYSWAVGTPLNVKYSNGADVDMPLAEEDEKGAMPDWFKSIMAHATGHDEQLTPLAPASPQVAPSGSRQQPGASSAPAGRTPADPIDMYWFKSPGLYPISIDLSEGRYFFTEPDYVHVPPGPGLADVRKHADGEGRIKIGVSPGSKFYPAVGRVWPRVHAGVLRSGTRQAQFRRLLTALGYNWGSQEADHVRDLQWAGEDDYGNLWPLDAAHNNAANRVLQQLVTYRDSTGNVVTVRLENTPLNRYFRIVGFNRPGGAGGP